MALIEVEHRGVIPKNEFARVKLFFEKNAKFIEEKDRFSVIYLQTRAKRIEETANDMIDLKVRITNKKAEIVMKYGKWGGKDSRKEFSFPIEKEKFDDAIEFFKILGWTHGVLFATKTFVYNHKGMEFALVEAPNWGYYFEAEILTDPLKADEADKKLEKECKKLGLELIQNKKFYKMLDALNSLPGMQFDFEKQDFEDVKKRFAKYF